MINNLEDLHDLIFNILEIPFRDLKYNNLISESNTILLDYAKNFGSSVVSKNNQDHFRISQNMAELELIDFIEENQGNWTISVNKKTNEIYTNEQALYTESDFSDYKKLDFGIEECLISFSLQEIYFAYYENDFKPKSELNFKPIWIDKKYNTDEITHSFFYDTEFKALKFNHSGGCSFDQIAFIR